MVDLFEKYDTTKLKEERAQTVQNLTHLQETLKSEAGPTTDQQAFNLIDYEMVLTQIQVLERKLQQLDEALQQVKQGMYGLCQRCGKPIDPARLEVLPETTFCLECKTILESQPDRQTTAAPPQSY